MVEAELTGNPFAHFLLAKDRNGVQDKRSLVVGYLCFWVVFEEVRLMNLAVIEPKRRGGLATALVTAALQEGISQAATRAVLEVRVSNTAAQSLYARFGFRRVSVRAKYYANPVEDAVLMELEPLVLRHGTDPSARLSSGGLTQPLP